MNVLERVYSYKPPLSLQIENNTKNTFSSNWITLRSYNIQIISTEMDSMTAFFSSTSIESSIMDSNVIRNSFSFKFITS